MDIIISHLEHKFHLLLHYPILTADKVIVQNVNQIFIFVMTSHVIIKKLISHLENVFNYLLKNELVGSIFTREYENVLNNCFVRYKIWANNLSSHSYQNCSIVF